MSEVECFGLRGQKPPARWSQLIKIGAEPRTSEAVINDGVTSLEKFFRGQLKADRHTLFAVGQRGFLYPATRGFHFGELYCPALPMEWAKSPAPKEGSRSRGQRRSLPHFPILGDIRSGESKSVRGWRDANIPWAEPGKRRHRHCHYQRTTSTEAETIKKETISRASAAEVTCGIIKPVASHSKGRM